MLKNEERFKSAWPINGGYNWGESGPMVDTIGGRVDQWWIQLGGDWTNGGYNWGESGPMVDTIGGRVDQSFIIVRIIVFL